MNEIVVTPDTFRRYGDITGQMAATTASAGLVDQAAVIAAVVPAFGLVGQDFLAAFAYSQANHLAGVMQLANVHEQTSQTAYNSAEAYDGVEDDSSRGFAAVLQDRAIRR
jgi:hypothetical protein